VALRDRVLEQDLLPGRRARDDGARAAVRALSAQAGRHRLPDLRRHDDRPCVLPARPPILESRRAERLAATVFGGVPARVFQRRSAGDDVVDRAALIATGVRSCPTDHWEAGTTFA